MPQLLQIPFPAGSAWFSQPITLQGVAYTMECRFNSREGAWYLNMLDVAQTPILMGVPMLINRDLLGQYSTQALPQGTLFVVDSTGKNTEAGLASFAMDHLLYFFDPLAG